MYNKSINKFSIWTNSKFINDKFFKISFFVSVFEFLFVLYMTGQLNVLFEKGVSVLNKLTKFVMLGPKKESISAMDKYWQKEMIARNYRFQVTNKIKLMQAFEFQMSAVNNYYAPLEIKISGTDSLEQYLSNLEEEDVSVTNRSSICFVIEERKYKILFLGDAVICDNGDIMEQLEKNMGRLFIFLQLSCHITEADIMFL